MPKINQKGRSKSSGHFMQLTRFMMETRAWRSLTPQERAVYLEIGILYNGANNGRLALSVRDAAARCRISKDTAGKCFQTLQERGFIECVREGSFNTKVRHATEWRLTMYKCNVSGQLSSRAFQHWAPPTSTLKKKRGPNSGSARSEQKDSPSLSPEDRYLSFGPSQENGPTDGTFVSDTYTF